jgi:hypothetical protein
MYYAFFVLDIVVNDYAIHIISWKATRISIPHNRNIFIIIILSSDYQHSKLIINFLLNLLDKEID